MPWEYEIEPGIDDFFHVTYFGDNGRVIPSIITFETEEEAEQAAEDYIENLDDILSEEWQ